MKRNIHLIIAIVAMTFGLLSCSDDPTSTTHKTKPLTLSNREQEICDHQNEYALNLLKLIAQDEDNVFVSPLSAAIVCAMTANGAKDATQNEILQAIGCDGYTMEELNAHYLNLMEKLPYQDATTYMAIANGVWVDNDFALLSDYADAVRTHYLAEVANMNLSDPASANVLNSWANKHTDGMIQNICNEDYFNDRLRLILANALCFKGRWDEAFDKKNTFDEAFHTPNGDVMVPMMHASEIGKATGSAVCYMHGDQWVEDEQGARILTLYYKDRGYCMDIVLPEPETTLTDVMNKLTVGWLDTMQNHNIAGAAVDVTMPKFKMKARYCLNAYMEALGMRRVFTPQADLTGISAKENLQLTILQQDTYIEVDEKGTKAAAVTTGWMECTAVEPSEPIVIDRPFVFFIRDVKNGIILFAGRINNPQY